MPNITCFLVVYHYSRFGQLHSRFICYPQYKILTIFNSITLISLAFIMQYIHIHAYISYSTSFHSSPSYESTISLHHTLRCIQSHTFILLISLIRSSSPCLITQFLTTPYISDIRTPSTTQTHTLTHNTHTHTHYISKKSIACFHSS